MSGKGLDGATTGVRLEDCLPFTSEGGSERFPNAEVVIDDEQLVHGGLPVEQIVSIRSTTGCRCAYRGRVQGQRTHAGSILR